MISSIFCQIDEQLVKIIREEADGRKVIDCGAGRGMLKSFMPEVIMMDFLPQDNPNVIVMDCTTYSFSKNMMLIFIRPCHSAFVEQTLNNNRSRIKSALYVSNPRNLYDDLGEYAEKAILIHDEWTGTDDNEKIYKAVLNG